MCPGTERALLERGAFVRAGVHRSAGRPAPSANTRARNADRTCSSQQSAQARLVRPQHPDATVNAERRDEPVSSSILSSVQTDWKCVAIMAVVGSRWSPRPHFYCWRKRIVPTGPRRSRRASDSARPTYGQPMPLRTIAQLDVNSSPHAKGVVAISPGLSGPRTTLGNDRGRRNQ